MAISSAEKRRQIIIVGGGVFGLSAAWHLATDAGTDVTVIDHPYSGAPSRDVSKILRIDYANPERTSALLNSRRYWEQEPVLKPHYKNTGRLVVYPVASLPTLDGIEKARSHLRLPPRKHLSGQTLREVFGSEPGTLDRVVVHNDDEGVLDWSAAMESIRRDCIRKGATFLEEHVTRFKVGVDGRIARIVTPSRSIEVADALILLSDSPWIMQLLGSSGISQPPASRAPVATGILSYSLDLALDQWEKYRKLPLVSEIGVGEFVCHPVHQGLAKVTWVRPFLNLSPKTGLSVPQNMTDSRLATQFKGEALAWLRQMIPELGTPRVVSVHSWWDGMTEDQNPLIARHPDHPNLVVAGGGSYTHAKDLPTIGIAIRDVLNENESHRSYGWALPAGLENYCNQPALRSDKNFGDLEIEASKGTL